MPASSPRAVRVPDHLKTTIVPIDTVRPLQKNPRRGDVDFVRGSVRRHGQYVPILVRRETGEILKGNHTWHALKAEGVETVAVLYRDVPTDDEAQRFALADNVASDRASWDPLELADTLKALDDLDGSGFADVDLKEVLAQADRILDAQRDPIREPPTPEPPAKPKTRLGDIVQLGDHRLLCGDARDPLAVKSLLAGGLANLVFTDPPYGVEQGRDVRKMTPEQRKRLHARAEPFDPIEGDGLDPGELGDLLVAALKLAHQGSTPDAAAYVWHADKAARTVEAALGAAGYEVRSQIVWAKTRAAYNLAQYKHQHEPAFYAYKRGEAPAWHGDRTQTTLWQVPQDDVGSYQHPTQKPVRLAATAIVNSSRPGEIVLDPFAGSGSTLLCAAQLDRRGYALELSAAYCDVIVSRWEALTGETAVRPARKRTTRPKEKTR